ncbi:amidase family protein [Mesorhizobium silamurunense]|uniref:amidase family protein n=1 Tax=Mesorhizobium silamurunense TaxID=499528 RepID=UPI0017814FB9
MVPQDGRPLRTVRLSVAPLGPGLPIRRVDPLAEGDQWADNDTYHRWMQVVIGPTLASLPSIGIPAGFDQRGLPMGMQIVGRPRGDRSVLEAALQPLEQAPSTLPSPVTASPEAADRGP